MDIFHSVLNGFSIALQPANIMFCFTGVLIGTLVGVLPGIGPAGAISILFPVTFRMPPTSAIIMLAGIYYGCQYGGSTTSILVNIPGEAASVVTCLDGYAMARQGRAGPALGIAAFGSFIAGTLGIVGLMLFASPLAEFGLKFGPPEYFGVIFMGLSFVIYLSRGSVIKGIMTGAFGIIVSCIGFDHIYGAPRLTFDLIQLSDGINIVPIAMGLFGVSEVLVNIEQTDIRMILETKIKNLFPTLSDWNRSKGAILRGTILGFFVGLVPGGTAVIASFLSYALEKRISKDPDKFGKGAIEGVAGPESANNSATSGAFIPLLTLGIPTTSIMALMFAALLTHGIQPGPFLLNEHPDLFWSLITSMYIGNVLLLIINLPLIPVWVTVLKVPARILFPLILLFCLIGSYSLNNSVFDVGIMLIFGIVGYLLRKFEYEGAPLLLAFVLGPIFELNLRQSLLLSGGSFLIFVTRPISAIATLLGMLLFVTSFLQYFMRRKKQFESLSRDD